MTSERSRIWAVCSKERWDILGTVCGGLGTDPARFDPPQREDPSAYLQLAGSLDTEPPEALMRTTCIVDLSRDPVQTWDVMTDTHPMRPTWLVWRFPEIHWIFLIDDVGITNGCLTPAALEMHFVNVRDPSPLFQLLERHAGGLRSWFDPWELRRACLGEEQHPPRQLGLVLDEEINFVAFNGYLLYRQGIPTALVPTAKEFCALADALAKEKKEGDDARRVTILEDVELNYPDARDQQIEDLCIPCQGNRNEDEDQGRMIASPNFYLTDCLNEMLERRLASLGLKDAPHQITRILVSSTLVPGRISVTKPFAGVYDREILSHLDCSNSQLASTRVRQGHSAPGARQAIAAALLSRARPLKSQGTDTMGAVHGALLAFEAERLLGHQTYAMALESMTLRHGLEAVAECSFAGAADELAVAPRVSDLQKHVRRLVFHRDTLGAIIRQLWPSDPDWRLNWSKLHKRQVQFSNGMLEALGMLRETYGQHHKFDEEEYALHQIRRWRVRSFQLKRSCATWLVSKLPKWIPDRAKQAVSITLRSLECITRELASVPVRYVTWVLNPFVLFAAIASLVVVFALLYQNLAWSGLLKGVDGFGFADWIRHSAATFLAMQQGTFGEPRNGPAEVKAIGDGFSAFWNITVSEMAVGYLHLAILVTVLIQKITRR